MSFFVEGESFKRVKLAFHEIKEAVEELFLVFIGGKTENGSPYQFFPFVSPDDGDRGVGIEDLSIRADDQ